MNGDGISREELYSRVTVVCMPYKQNLPRFAYELVGIVAYRIMARYNVGLGDHPSKYRGEGKAYSMLEDECV